MFSNSTPWVHAGTPAGADAAARSSSHSQTCNKPYTQIPELFALAHLLLQQVHRFLPLFHTDGILIDVPVV